MADKTKINKKAMNSTIVGMIIVLFTFIIIMYTVVNAVGSIADEVNDKATCFADIEKMAYRENHPIKGTLLGTPTEPRCVAEVKYVTKGLADASYEMTVLKEVENAMADCDRNFGMLKKSKVNFICSYLYLSKDLDVAKLKSAYDEKKDGFAHLNETKFERLQAGITSGKLGTNDAIIVVYDVFEQVSLKATLYKSIDLFMGVKEFSDLDKSLKGKSDAFPSWWINSAIYGKYYIG